MVTSRLVLVRLFFLFHLRCVHSFSLFILFFFFNDTATTEIYTLSLHDALPILDRGRQRGQYGIDEIRQLLGVELRSEEHTSELQSHSDLVCRLLLEKKKNLMNKIISRN